jgi:hypothetical protein
MTACPPSARQSIVLCPTAERDNDSRKWNTDDGVTALPENGDLLIGGAFALKRVSGRRKRMTAFGISATSGGDPAMPALAGQSGRAADNVAGPSLVPEADVNRVEISQCSELLPAH